MKKSLLIAAFGTLFVASTTFAQTAAPAAAPAKPAVTAICKDGTTYSGTTMKGACRGHHGVDKNAGATAGVVPASAPAAKPLAVAAPAPAAAMAPAPGAGAGQVWANTSTKVYHCPGDQYYGKTKHGSYMSEGDAKAKGYHADHGKTCQ
ncbi:conserved exported hypothetical protein [Paraburkholderia ribeironis]|uniref:Alanin-rich signal peptide protein n=1 Tax=Paraburkholderia ribeironis TaxID=1247936 RepID=A0A1N7S8P7_9BURK|nr:hypothetical protein [Paraburkholderia ribeironis]SIT43744.1 conserved exported hypothetical protein [Paraburkholderia ribeironis]